MGRGVMLLRQAILAHTDPRYENAKQYSAMVVTGIETDSTGGIIAARGTINGTGEDTIPLRGASSASVGDTLLISYDDPTGQKTYVRHIASANPVPQIVTNGSLPDPQFDTVPFTSDLSTNPGSILSNGVVHFLAVEERYFPEGYTASFRIVGQEWRESGFAPHLGGTQEITLASDFRPGTTIQVRLRGHYAGFSNLSPGLDTRTFVTAVDNITPGVCTGITVDLTIPGALKLTPIGTFDADHFDHFRYYIATSAIGAGLVTLDGPTGFVYAGAPGARYVAVAPISKSGVVGTRYPSVAGTYDGPHTIVIATPALDTTPPPQWAAPTLAQSTNNSANGGEEHWLTVTLNTNANYASTTNPAASVADYDYTLITISGTGYASQQQIFPANNSVRVLVEAVGLISVTAIGVDKLGNKGTASTTATITISPTGVPATMGNVTTQSGSLGVVVRWTTIADAIGYIVSRATSVGGAGATVLGYVAGHLYVDLFNGAAIAGTVYYYKVQAYNLKGNGGQSPTWIPGTVGAFDGSNIVAGTVTAAKLEATLILGSIIRTPMNASGFIGLYGNAGNSALQTYNASSVLTMNLDGAGLSYYRNGTDLRLQVLPTGMRFYKDTGSSVLRMTILGDGFRMYDDNGTTQRGQWTRIGFQQWDAAFSNFIFLGESGGNLVFVMPKFSLTTAGIIVELDNMSAGMTLLVDTATTRYFRLRKNTTSELGVLPSHSGMGINFDSATLTVNNLILAFINSVSTAQFTDANNWIGGVLMSGKRIWRRRVTINSGWPAATAWIALATASLPVGISSLSQVNLQSSFVASTWARVMTIAPDAVTGTNPIVFNGTLAAGPGNWNAINPTILLDLVATEN